MVSFWVWPLKHLRQAENGVAVLQKLAEKIGDVTGKGARLEIITQRREAELGVIGAASIR